MSTGVLFSLPLRGHVNPTLSLVREFNARGERVLYYCTAAFREEIEAAGAEFRRLPATFPSVSDFQSAGVYTFFNAILRTAERALPQLLRDLPEEGAADRYVMYDFMCPWARLLCRRRSSPAVCLFPGVVPTPQMLPPVPLTVLFGLRSPKRELRDFLSFQRVSARLAARHGGPRWKLMDLIAGVREGLNVSFSGQPLHPPFSEPGSEVLFVGHAINEARDARPSLSLDELPTDRPLVYMSLGTIFNRRPELFHKIIEAFADTEMVLLLSTGSAEVRRAVGRLPDNVFAYPLVPQLQVLKRASLFITHGGHNSVTESLYFGVPMIVLPQGAEQFLIARRVHALGCGSWWPDRLLSAWRLRRLARRLLRDEGVRQSLVSAGEQVIAGGGCRRAVDAILRYRDTHR